MRDYYYCKISKNSISFSKLISIKISNFLYFFIRILGKGKISEIKVRIVWGTINNIKVKIERILDQDSTISSYFILTKMISDRDLTLKSYHEKINEKSEILGSERNLQNNARNEENDEEDKEEIKRNNQKKSKREKNNEFNRIIIDSAREKKTENLIGKNNKIKITEEFHEFTIKLKIKRFLLHWNR